jgi:hypothetical protein
LVVAVEVVLVMTAVVELVVTGRILRFLYRKVLATH